MQALSVPLEEAKENLRVIRQTMERSTRFSTLSGWSGVLIGIMAIVCVFITRAQVESHHSPHSGMPAVAILWMSALVAAIAIDFGCNKWRAARVGKHVVSRLGAHIILAALPAFVTGAVLTVFFYENGLILQIWGAWMLCYGLAICAVGLFSIKPVSLLGAAFVVSGAITLLLPAHFHYFMMALTFGGYHIVYGLLMARKYGW